MDEINNFLRPFENIVFKSPANIKQIGEINDNGELLLTTLRLIFISNTNISNQRFDEIDLSDISINPDRVNIFLSAPNVIKIITKQGNICEFVVPDEFKESWSKVVSDMVNCELEKFKDNETNNQNININNEYVNQPNYQYVNSYNNQPYNSGYYVKPKKTGSKIPLIICGCLFFFIVLAGSITGFFILKKYDFNIGSIFNSNTNKNKFNIISNKYSPTEKSFDVTVDEFISKYNSLTDDGERKYDKLQKKYWKYWGKSSVRTDLYGNKYEVLDDGSNMLYYYMTEDEDYIFCLYVEKKCEKIIGIDILCSPYDYHLNDYFFDVTTCVTGVDAYEIYDYSQEYFSESGHLYDYENELFFLIRESNKDEKWRVMAISEDCYREYMDNLINK